jgi:hypothetical protein
MAEKPKPKPLIPVHSRPNPWGPGAGTYPFSGSTGKPPKARDDDDKKKGGSVKRKGKQP